MESSYYCISKQSFIDLLDRLAKHYSVYVPYRKNETLSFGKLDPEQETSIEIGQIRQSQPLKSFLNQALEKVMVRDPRSEKQGKKTVVVGVKACDLVSLRIQDYVFKEGDYKDPFYIEERESTVIIASDCADPKETCFCVAMNGKPYPEKEFDINLSLLKSVSKESYLVEVATEKGTRILNEFRSFFTPGDSSHIKFRDELRRKVTAQIEQFLQKRSTQRASALGGIMKKQFGNIELWSDNASTCVECGACNLVCPTCHCFLLSDQKVGGVPERLKAWDSCLYKTFARVAGGANPRKHLWERLRNRFDKKFGFFAEVLNTFACTGCGRCIEACPGDIDIREVLKGLVTGTWAKPPHL